MAWMILMRVLVLLCIVLLPVSAVHGAESCAERDVRAKETVAEVWDSYKNSVNALIQRGKHPNGISCVIDNRCLSVLQAAVVCSDAEYAASLIKANADPLVPVRAYSTGISGVPNTRSLLFDARDKATAELLIKHKADVASRDAHVDRQPLLSYAAQNEQVHEDVIDLLIAHKAE